jgi:hypothetical protein
MKTETFKFQTRSMNGTTNHELSFDGARLKVNDLNHGPCEAVWCGYGLRVFLGNGYTWAWRRDEFLGLEKESVKIGALRGQKVNVTQFPNFIPNEVVEEWCAGNDEAVNRALVAANSTFGKSMNEIKAAALLAL